MCDLLLAVGNLWHADFWYILPAVAAISLVYAATRHERMRPILLHAGRVAVWILGAMFAFFVALEAMNWFV
ncbi:MAG: hypothetical protein LLF97_04950 [Planctomycetaceae bacterium]|nr:hypothetical protein [Planctomycetaceae bacterium]